MNRSTLILLLLVTLGIVLLYTGCGGLVSSPSSSPPPPGSPPPNSVVTWHNDLARTGQNLQETTLTPANVNSTQFGKLFQFAVDGDAYAQSLYMPSLSMSGGVKNVLFVATEHDSVYAFDADGNTTAPLWKTSFIDPANDINTLTVADTGACCPAPEIGITGTPVIDPQSNTLYVVVRTNENGTLVQRLHALDILTGAKKNSVTIAASVPGTGDGTATVSFNNTHENQRPGLLLLNGTVFVTWGSHSDIHPYHGWVIGYSAATLQQTVTFNVTPNGQEGGIWMSGGAPAADGAGNIFFATGNGPFDPSHSNYSQSFLKLSPQGTVLDYFTPFDWAQLNVTDLDIAAGGPLLLPDQPGSHPHLLVSADKNRTIYLIDRDNMGKNNATDNNQIVQSIRNAFPDLIRSLPAYWNGFVYWAGLNDVVKAFHLDNGKLSAAPVATGTVSIGFPGATPSISANKSTNGIVWLVDNKGFGVLRAYDATNVAHELYNSSSARDTTSTNYIRFAVPTIMNGKVYVATSQKITVYGLL